MFLFMPKQKILPFTNNTHKYDDMFYLVHMDIRGPLPIPSMNDHKYFLTIVDDKIKCTWIFLMKCKSETSTLIKAFVSIAHTQFKTKFKFIRLDNDSEFLLRDFFSETGISHQTSHVVLLNKMV